MTDPTFNFLALVIDLYNSIAYKTVVTNGLFDEGGFGFSRSFFGVTGHNIIRSELHDKPNRRR